MTDRILLEKAIRESGIKISMLLKVTGIRSYATFRGRLANMSEFRAGEIDAICDLLGLTAEQRDRIFFARKVS